SPYKTVSFDILYGKGISKVSEILDLAVSLNLIKKNGMWYSYKIMVLQPYITKTKRSRPKT
ncbi:MAG: hypothetical protein Q8730_02445, partial [Sweet potato little leaf phytoplasma]|nr:hypothetical protein [Sweet potato little leaf phytoplasma]